MPNDDWDAIEAAHDGLALDLSGLRTTGVVLGVLALCAGAMAAWLLWP